MKNRPYIVNLNEAIAVFWNYTRVIYFWILKKTMLYTANQSLQAS